MKDTIKSILKSWLGHVYCDTCTSNDTGDGCDECYRKQMGWGLSDSTAGRIADEIIKEQD